MLKALFVVPLLYLNARQMWAYLQPAQRAGGSENAETGYTAESFSSTL